MTDNPTDEPVDLDTAPEAEAPEAATEPPAAEEPDDTPEESPNAEAAKWRHKFRDEQNGHRETREALESMSARVEALQRQQVENLLDAAQVKPAALWATAELATLLTEDGTVDAQAVKTAIDAARKTLGISPIGKGNFVPGVGHQPSGPPRKAAEFADAFKPKRK